MVGQVMGKVKILSPIVENQEVVLKTETSKMAKHVT